MLGSGRGNVCLRKGNPFAIGISSEYSKMIIRPQHQEPVPGLPNHLGKIVFIVHLHRGLRLREAGMYGGSLAFYLF